MGLLVLSEPGQSFCFYFKILLVFDSWVIKTILLKEKSSPMPFPADGFCEMWDMWIQGLLLLQEVWELRNGESEAQRPRRDWSNDKLPISAIGVYFWSILPIGATESHSVYFPAISRTGTTESLRCCLPIHPCFYMTFFLFAFSFISFYRK